MSGSYYTLDAKYNTLLALIQQNATTGNTLEAVLTQGNDAAGLSMTNVNNIDLVTINGSAYPPLVAGDDLEQVLTNGNDANGLSITNLNQLTLTGTSTITDSTGDLVIQPPTNQTLQLANNIYVDTQNNRVGINVPAPTEDLELDGNFQLNTGATSKIVFYDSPADHEHAEIDAAGDGTNGGILQFFTKVDGGGVSKKLSINNTGAIGIGDPVDYGTSGEVLTSNGASAPTWSAIPTPTDINITDDNTNAVFYPTFVSGTGTQTLLADTTTTQFSINPNTSDFNVGSTLKLTQTQVAVGKSAGSSGQGASSVAVGIQAGQTTQGDFAVAIGIVSGQTAQGNSATAVGNSAGKTNQATLATAVGKSAGSTNQSSGAVAVGNTAGQTSQSTNAVAIGNAAGNNTQGTNSVAIGNIAGQTNQLGNSVAIGNAAGTTNQADNNVAIGGSAGNNTQGRNSVAIGINAGQTTQGAGSVAIGRLTAQTSQGADAVAIGNAAGQTSQSTNAVAVGTNAGTTSQGASSVAVGYFAGNNTQGLQATAVGIQAGQTTQGDNAVGVGIYAGRTSQGISAVAVGNTAGFDTQGTACVAVGASSGQNNQGNYATAIGYVAGQTTQGTNATALGTYAGNNTQGASSVAVGYTAGQNNQGTACIAVGSNAGTTTQGNGSIAIGGTAGTTNQGTGAVAVGLNAGTTTQSNNSTAVGSYAGQITQGANAVAVGYLAGQTNQTAGSIALNASGVALNPAVAGCFINPIRADATEHLPLQYNTTTNEVSRFNWTDLLTPTSYNPVLQSVGGNLNSGNYTVRNGYYIQLGKIVWFEVRIQISGKSGLGAGSEDIRVTLPVTASNITDLTQSLNIGNITGMTTSIVSAFANIPSGGQDYAVFPIKTAASTGTSNTTVSDISTSFQIRFGGFYFSN